VAEQLAALPGVGLWARRMICLLAVTQPDRHLISKPAAPELQLLLMPVTAPSAQVFFHDAIRLLQDASFLCR